MSNDSLEAFAERKLRSLERRHLKRSVLTVDRVAANRVENEGDALISFSCNDYLGLARDPETIAASLAATEKHGVGAGASRLITGSHSGYRGLEQSLARIKASEDAVVFGSGYLVNLGVIPVLTGQADLILIDELAHSCMRSGALLSRARVVAFDHNDATAARRVLETERSSHRHCLILTEGVFSMDGDRAPLPELAGLARQYDAWLMTDDAHGLGVVGGGRGSTFAHPVPVEAPLQMGTLSKAVGSYGGYLCASRAVCELIRNRARSFVYSTGLPPGTVAAATRALEIIATDTGRTSRPLDLATRFCEALGLPRAESAIVPIVIGSSERAIEVSQALREFGLLVVAIRPPTVPAGTARLRITFSAGHSDSDLDTLIRAMRELGLVTTGARDHHAA